MLKTSKQIEDEIELSHGFKKVYLFTVLRYIETCPKESFIISEIEKLNNFIKSKKNQYTDYLKNNLIKDNLKERKKYSDMYQLTNLRRQIKVLKYCIRNEEKTKKRRADKL